MKICFVCKTTKEHIEFYKDKSRSDGFANRCKICDRDRKRIRIRKKNPKHQKAWVNNNPEKYEAHKAIKRALYNNLIKKTECFVCGNPKVEAHHADYKRPLDVIWMCRTHHKETHRIIN